MVVGVCPHCTARLVRDDELGTLSVVPPAPPTMDEARLSAILGRAVAKQAETIAAQADQIVSLSKS